MDASAHRANARDALLGNWVNAVIAAFLVSTIGKADGFRLNINFNFDGGRLLEFSAPDRMWTVLRLLGFALPVIAMIQCVVLVFGMIVGGILKLGAARYNLNLIDRRSAELSDLLTGIPRFTDGLVMHLLSTLLTFLGFLLLVVPGVMLRYGFAMAPYILAEDPGCSGQEALRRSYEMMRGHRLELFWLELSFLGWDILASFTLGVGILLLNPYKAAARASFYRELCQA